jgi:DNA-binding NtrC family response regulator
VLDGLAMTQELARQQRAIPIILMSAAPAGRQVAEAIGAAGYLAKPFDVDALLELVAEVCPVARQAEDPDCPDGPDTPPATA